MRKALTNENDGTEDARLDDLPQSPRLALKMWDLKPLCCCDNMIDE